MALSKIDVANMLTGATPTANGGTGSTAATLPASLINNTSIGNVTALPAAIDTGAMVLLTSGDITSTTSSIAITGTHVTSTYDHYRMYVRGKAAGDGIQFYMRYRNSSNDGLVSSNYGWRLHADATNGGGSNSDGTSVIKLTNYSYLGSNTNEGFNMIIDFMSPLSNLVPTCVNWWIGAANTSDSWYAQRGMARRNDGTETHTGFTLYFDTGGDFANGTNYEFYGITK